MATKGLNIYKVKYRLGMQDPLVPGNRHHTVIFVETDGNGGGYIHHVIGDIASVKGMRYQVKRGRKPDISGTFFSKTYLGQLNVSDYPDAVEWALQSIPPPPRQRVFNTKTLTYEKCKPDGTRYEPHETRPPYSKCTEWVEQKAIPLLHQRGLIHVNGVSTSSQHITPDEPGPSDWVWDKDREQYRYWTGSKWEWR